MRMSVAAAAETSGGEEQYKPDDGESPDDQGFLEASASDREARIHPDGGDHDVHGLIVTESHYKDITATPSA